MFEAAQAPVDPYSEAYSLPAADNAEATPAAPAAEAPAANGRGRSRSRSPGYRGRSPARDEPRRSPARPSRPPGAPANPNPSKVLGVFGLSIRTTERDLEDEFGRFGHVEKVTIVYDQRSDRSRGFGFIQMGSSDEAARCIEALNGVDLNGRRIRVDYSVTERAHAPTPGEYMGHRRPLRDERDYRDRDRRDDRYRDRDRDYRDRDRDHRGYDRDRRDRRDDYGRDRDNWRDRRSPPPRRHSRSPPPRRRSYSRSPPPRSPRKEYGNGDRW